MLPVLLLVAGFFLSWWFTRYQVTDDHVRVNSGVLFRQHRQARLDRVQATDNPASVGPVDYVIFCVKLWDVESAGAAIRPLVRPGTAVIPQQNGVDAHEQEAIAFFKMFPDQHLINNPYKIMLAQG